MNTKAEKSRRNFQKPTPPIEILSVFLFGGASPNGGVIPNLHVIKIFIIFVEVINFLNS